MPGAGQLRRRRRWAVPPLIVGLIAAGIVLIPRAVTAGGSPSLRPISAPELVAKVLGGQVDHLVGALSLTADLDLPNLSEFTGNTSNPLAFLSGTHTSRLWYGGAGKLRVALPDGPNEDDLYLNGPTDYVWQGATFSVTKIALPSLGAAHILRRGSTPAQMAGRLLASIGPSTAMKVGSTAYVAGRPAYQLSLSPRNAQSLVGRVVISVDSATGLPLRVELFARDAGSPAFSFGFTRIGSGAPAAFNFDFEPPPGAKLKTLDLSSAPRLLGALDLPLPHLVGSGWTSVLVIPAVDFSVATAYLGLSSGGRHAASELGPILESGRAVSGKWGSGRLLRSSLVDLLRLADGTVLVGAVTPPVLEAAAARAG